MNTNSNRDAILTRLAGSSSIVSGDLLANELGLSRAGVWKHIEALRKQGINITSHAGRGYQLRSDVLTASMLSAIVDRRGVDSRGVSRRVASSIVVLDEIDSTNREVMRRAEAGAEEGLVIIADKQSKGRGRLGRSWFSSRDDSLTISILLRPDIAPESVPQLSLLAAVAVQHALANFVPEICIKWPNDLLVNGEKIAGILTEMRGEPGRVHAVVLGIGLNIRKPANGWPQEIKQRATDLTSASGRNISRLEVAATLLQSLDYFYNIYLNEGFAPIRRAWWAAHAASGQLVRAHHGHNISDSYIEGIAEALDEDGALLLRVEGQLQRFVAGDLELMDNNSVERAG